MRLRLPFVQQRPRSPLQRSPLQPLRACRAQASLASTTESRLGELILRMEEPPLLAAGAHDAILRRLHRLERLERTERMEEPRPTETRGRELRRGAVRRVLARPALVVGIALSALFLAIAAQAAISWVRRGALPWAREAPAAAPLPDARAVTRHAGLLRRGMTPAITADEAGVDPDAMPTEIPSSPSSSPPPAPPASPAHQKPRLRVGASVAKVTASSRTLPPPSSLAQESRLLGAALAALRTDRDYVGALATLDEYDARFPNGALRGEAALARLDALMALGQSAAALRLLDGRGQGPGQGISGPRAAEVLVVRGELRAGAGRYQEAIGDFDRAASLTGNRQLKERALYGRLSCRARSGDGAGSARDAQDYLSRFPDGPHAAELRRRKSTP